MKKLIQFSILIFFTLIVFLVPVASFAESTSTPVQLDVQYKYPWRGATSPADFISQFYSKKTLKNHCPLQEWNSFTHRELFLKNF